MATGAGSSAGPQPGIDWDTKLLGPPWTRGRGQEPGARRWPGDELWSRGQGWGEQMPWDGAMGSPLALSLKIETGNFSINMDLTS